MDDVGMDGINDSAVPDLIASTLISEDSVKKSFPIVKSPSTDIKSILLIVHKAKKKTVRWVEDTSLAQIKYFKLDDRELKHHNSKRKNYFIHKLDSYPKHKSIDSTKLYSKEAKTRKQESIALDMPESELIEHIQSTDEDILSDFGDHYLFISSDPIKDHSLREEKLLKKSKSNCDFQYIFFSFISLTCFSVIVFMIFYFELEFRPYFVFLLSYILFLCFVFFHIFFH